MQSALIENSPLWFCRLFAALVVLFGATGATAGPAVPMPEVTGPIVVTENSRPFLDAREAMAEVGYVEREFFIAGLAHSFDWTGKGHGIEVVAGPGAYTTRILVRRPADPERFSGNVEVYVLNATRGYDAGTFTDFERMTDQGDVWVGITSKWITARALKRFDAERYAPLKWDNPAPQSQRCERPTFYPVFMTGEGLMIRILGQLGMVPLTSFPDTEDGLIWDMLAQLGVLLKSENRQQILPGFSEPKLFMTGVSQSSILIYTWTAAFHDYYRLPDGGPIYDGYLAIVGPALARLNQCAKDVPLEDPRQKLDPPDVPFITLSSEGENWLSKYTHRPNAFNETGGIVSYEVAGAAHSALEIPGAPRRIVGTPTDEEVEIVAPKSFDLSLMVRLMLGSAERSDFVWRPVVRAAYENLKLWANEGIRPPQTPFLEYDEQLRVARDEWGNARGGLRLPYIDAPLAQYTGSISDAGLGGTIGTKEPLPDATLKALYPNQAVYVEKFSQATDRVVSSRLVLPEDGEPMKKAARDVSLPE